MADRKLEEKLSRRHGGYTKLAFWLRQDEYLQRAALASKIGVAIHDRRDISLPCQGPKIKSYRASNTWAKPLFGESRRTSFCEGDGWSLSLQFANGIDSYARCTHLIRPSRFFYGDELSGESPRKAIRRPLEVLWRKSCRRSLEFILWRKRH